MYNYENCKTVVEALTQYQSNVRQIMLNIESYNIKTELFRNDEEFLDYLTGRYIKNVNAAVNQEI